MWRSKRQAVVLLALAVNLFSLPVVANQPAKRSAITHPAKVVSVSGNPAGNFVLLTMENGGQLSVPRMRLMPGEDGHAMMAVDFSGVFLACAPVFARIHGSGVEQLTVGQLQTSPPVLRIALTATNVDVFQAVQFKTSASGLIIRLPAVAVRHEAPAVPVTAATAMAPPRPAPARVLETADHCPPVAPDPAAVVTAQPPEVVPAPVPITAPALPPRPPMPAPHAVSPAVPVAASRGSFVDDPNLPRLRGPIAQDVTPDASFTPVQKSGPFKRALRRFFGEQPQQQGDSGSYIYTTAGLGPPAPMGPPAPTGSAGTTGAPAPSAGSETPAAAENAPVAPLQAPARLPGNYLIVLDAGHGGHDPGAQRGDIQEKELTLSIIGKLKRDLDARGIHTRLTRGDDTFVSLEDRVKITNELRPDAFVSVHINAMQTNEQTTGIETYYQTDASRELAELIHAQLVQQLKAPDRGVRKARFYVINHTPVPAILAEVGFISNKEERDRLVSSDYQSHIAEACADGVMLYLSQHSTAASEARPSASKGISVGTISALPPSSAPQSFTQNLHSKTGTSAGSRRSEGKRIGASGARNSRQQPKTKLARQSLKFKKSHLASLRS